MMINVSSIYWIDIDPYWDQFAPIPLWAHLAYGYIAVLVAVVAFITNITVASFYSRFSLSPLRVYIVSLALSDALSPAITYWMILQSSYHRVWQFNQTSCSMYGFVQGYLSLVSITTLAAVSVEAAVRIRKNVQRGRPKLQFGICIILWTYSAVGVVPPLFGWSRYTPEGFLTSCCFDFIRRDWATRSFIVYLFTLGFGAPCLFIAASYIYTLKHVCSKRQSLAGRAKSQATRATPIVQLNIPAEDTNDMSSPNPVSSRSRQTNASDYWEEEHRMLDNESLSELEDGEVRRRNVQSAVMMLVVVVVFMLAWTPYAILALIGQFGPENVVGPYSVAAAGLLAKSSTMLNPFIYVVMDPRFRQLIRERFCWCCCRDRPYVDIFTHL